MLLLPKTFQKDGFTHTEVNREGDLAIYRQTKQIGDTIIERFEVVVIRCSKEWEAFGQTFPASELYPLSKYWGKYGFTCQNMEAAWIRFRKLQIKNPLPMPDFPRITSFHHDLKRELNHIKFYPNGEVGYWSQQSRIRVRERSVLKSDFDAMPAAEQRLIIKYKIPIRYERS